MEREKIIEKIVANRTGRPPIRLLKIVEHLMSIPRGKWVSVGEVARSLGFGSTTVNDAFHKLDKLEYLSKERLNKEEYRSERSIKTGKKDVHRLPYIYKLSDKLYNDFNACRDNIQKKALDEFTDCQCLTVTLENGLLAHVALHWAGIWNTNLGPLEIKDGRPITGKYPNGKIEAVAVRDTLKGSWYEGSKSGSFEFKMDANSKSFSGKRLGNTAKRQIDINQRLGGWSGVLLSS